MAYRSAVPGSCLISHMIPWGAVRSRAIVWLVAAGASAAVGCSSSGVDPSAALQGSTGGAAGPPGQAGADGSATGGQVGSGGRPNAP